MNKKTFKNKFLIGLLIIVLILVGFLALYETEIINVQPKCYNYAPGIVNCYTIFQKGYWIKQQSSDNNYLSDTIGKTNIVEEKPATLTVDCDPTKIKDLFAKARASNTSSFTISSFGCFPSGDQILKSANAYLTKYLGEDYVKKYITFEPKNLKFTLQKDKDEIRSFYNLLFWDSRFAPEKGRNSIAIYLYQDQDFSYSVYGKNVPNCVADPKICEKNVTYNEAFLIAKNNGIEANLGIVLGNGDGWLWVSPEGIRSTNSSLECPVFKGVKENYPVKKIEINIATGKTNVIEKCEYVKSPSPFSGGDQ